MQSVNKSKKHIPQRTCIGCREEKNKSELLRLVRTEDGEIKPDESARTAGRGAYICKNKDCLEKAIKTKALERAFKESIKKETCEKLRLYFEAAFESRDN